MDLIKNLQMKKLLMIITNKFLDMRPIIYIALFFQFFLISCKSHQKINYRNVDMENTIPFGSEVSISRATKIDQNKLVAFKMPNSTEVKILRVLGMPGDEIEIVKGEIYINRNIYYKPILSKQIYTVYLKNTNLFGYLKKYKSRPYSDHYSMFSLSENEYREIQGMKIVDSIYLLGADSNYVQKGVIKNKYSKYVNNFYFGPITVPYLNTLIDEDILSIIPVFLSNSKKGNKITEEYFFCIGDNYPEAKDSRFIGLIPFSSIIGIVDKIR